MTAFGLLLPVALWGSGGHQLLLLGQLIRLCMTSHLRTSTEPGMGYARLIAQAHEGGAPENPQEALTLGIPQT